MNWVSLIFTFSLNVCISFLRNWENLRDSIKCNASFLCISEYPHELHDLQKDYPLAPEFLQTEENIFSDYQRHLLQDEGFSKTPSKLVRNLRKKTSYIFRYRNLKLYLEVGLYLTNVQRASIVFCLRSIAMVKKLHQIQDSSTYSCKKWFWRKRWCMIRTLIFTYYFFDAAIYWYRFLHVSNSNGNMYEDFYVYKHLFDFSRYEKEIPFYDNENKKVIGKMKDELNEEISEEFIGLRARMYSLKAKEKKKGRRQKEWRRASSKKTLVIKTMQIFYLKKENLCKPYRLFDHLNIKSIKSHLALTITNDTW